MSNVYGSNSTPSGGVSVPNDGAKHTILQLTSPANQCVKNFHFSFSGQGISPTDPPAQIRVLRQTATTGTATNNPPVATSNNAQAVQSTGRANFSVEPTAGNVLWEGFMHPQLGDGLSFVLSEEFVLGGATSLGIEATVKTTSSAALVMHATQLFEE